MLLKYSDYYYDKFSPCGEPDFCELIPNTEI